MTNAEDEVVSIAQDLIRIDTTNTGERETTVGEIAAAEYVAASLAEVGISSTIVESEPGRASLTAKIAGANPDRPGLILHGHLDVVPAFADEWSVPPFAGQIRDDYLWGRGAVDMKHMDAMILAVIRGWARTGVQPPRDIVLAFFADEEAGGHLGAHWVVDNHPDVFAGCSQAVGEVGGYSLPVADSRLYVVQTAEKGMGWLRLRASGTAGHGSLLNADNAVGRLATAVAALAGQGTEIRIVSPARELLAAVAEMAGVEWDGDDPSPVVAALGNAQNSIGATLCTTMNPTMLNAGYKANVVPSEAEAVVDIRALPGDDERVDAILAELVGAGIVSEWITRQPAIEAPFAEVPLYDAMVAALHAEDPKATVAPYLMPGGTDAKALSRLGIDCYGFAPLQLPPDLDYLSLFHGVDERVPLPALRFGVRVLERFLATC